MDVGTAVADVLLGASLRQIAAVYRQSLIEAFDFRPEDLSAETFLDETMLFMRKVARHLGDRHAGDARVGAALHAWVQTVDHYEAWDALLSGFEFPGKGALVRRGRKLFAGPLTAHWQGDGD